MLHHQRCHFIFTAFVHAFINPCMFLFALSNPKVDCQGNKSSPVSLERGRGGGGGLLGAIIRPNKTNTAIGKTFQLRRKESLDMSLFKPFGVSLLNITAVHVFLDEKVKNRCEQTPRSDYSPSWINFWRSSNILIITFGGKHKCRIQHASP